jgi:hypothetical protein
VTADSGSFCDVCGAALESAPARPENPVAGTAAQNPHITPADGAMARTLPGTPILLGDGEVIYRQYQVLQLRSRAHGEGILYVTDSRVVFYAKARGRGAQRPSALVQQTKLEHVTGLAAYVSRRISLLLLTAIILLGLAAVIELTRRSWVPAIILAALTAGGVTMLAGGAANRGSVGVMIQSGSTQESPIGFGQFGDQRGPVGSLFHALFHPLLALFGVFTAFDVLLGFPGQDSDQVVAELGALIFDLQTRGSLANTHWHIAPAEGQPAIMTRE